MKPVFSQSQRRWTQAGFLALFFLLPVFDLLRYDLTTQRAWVLGFSWQLGVEALRPGRMPPLSAFLPILLYLVLPLVLSALAFVWVARRWGRIYCGWLCPHFGAVELFNHLFARRERWAKWALLPLAVACGFLFMLGGLTYLMPPAHVYAGLWTGDLRPTEVGVLVFGTVAFALELLLARHLFCRYACSVGILQSLAWMSHPGALVVGMDRSRLAECGDCPGADGFAKHSAYGSACDAVCPVRLKPRTLKRWMFSCTQCGLCVDVCGQVNQAKPAGGLLHWQQGEVARQGEAVFSALQASGQGTGGADVAMPPEEVNHVAC